MWRGVITLFPKRELCPVQVQYSVIAPSPVGSQGSSLRGTAGGFFQWVVNQATSLLPGRTSTVPRDNLPISASRRPTYFSTIFRRLGGSSTASLRQVGWQPSNSHHQSLARSAWKHPSSAAVPASDQISLNQSCLRGKLGAPSFLVLHAAKNFHLAPISSDMPLISCCKGEVPNHGSPRIAKLHFTGKAA